jgi:hypothetical protein
MPLTDEEQREEYQRRMDHMAINIEKMRSDMVWESRKFLLQAVVSAAALVGAGAALGNYLARRELPPPPPAPPQVIFQPGSIVVTPAAPAAQPK